MPIKIFGLILFCQLVAAGYINQSVQNNTKYWPVNWGVTILVAACATFLIALGE